MLTTFRRMANPSLNGGGGPLFSPWPKVGENRGASVLFEPDMLKEIANVSVRGKVRWNCNTLRPNSREPALYFGLR